MNPTDTNVRIHEIMIKLFLSDGSIHYKTFFSKAFFLYWMKTSSKDFYDYPIVDYQILNETPVK